MTRGAVRPKITAIATVADKEEVDCGYTKLLFGRLGKLHEDMKKGTINRRIHTIPKGT
jgi:hypothetical protein